MVVNESLSQLQTAFSSSPTLESRRILWNNFLHEANLSLIQITEVEGEGVWAQHTYRWRIDHLKGTGHSVFSDDDELSVLYGVEQLFIYGVGYDNKIGVAFLSYDKSHVLEFFYFDKRLPV